MHSGAALGRQDTSFVYFDWLRFALASVVVLAHAGYPLFANASNFAVCVFLALSGWLIGGILLRTTQAELPRFYFNRSFRIWVPYLVAIILLYSAAALREGLVPRFWEFLTDDLTFTHYWFIPKVPETFGQMPLQGTGSHFWSISVEEQFYLIAPLIMLWVGAGRHLLTWLVLFAVTVALDHHYASIAGGVLAAIVHARHPALHRHPAVVGLCVAALICFAWVGHADPWYRHGVPLVSVAVVVLCARQGARAKLGLFLGAVSYPLYLNHWLGLFAANALTRKFGNAPVALHLGLSYGLAVLAGVLSYWAVDRWVMRYRGPLYTARRGRVLMVCAYGLILVGVLAQWLVFRAR